MPALSREHVNRLLIDLDVILLDGGFIGDEDYASFKPLVLQLERDAPNPTLLVALHEMGRESGNLVAKALGRDYGNLIEYISSCWCGNQESFSSSSSSITCRDDFFTVLVRIRPMATPASLFKC
ncbi:hypothetical protein SLEP1_g19090 [Rubroshorea leprosula]|nr:hypothetical protein SLEP1_g19090 [Rubroshorea leprosula]